MECNHPTLVKQLVGTQSWYKCSSCGEKFKTREWDGKVKVAEPAPAADEKILSVGAVEEVIAKIRTLTAELEQVKAERDHLRTFTKHKSGCKILEPWGAGEVPKKCSCGLLVALGEKGRGTQARTEAQIATKEGRDESTKQRTTARVSARLRRKRALWPMP